MTTRQRIIAALSGREAGPVPVTTYDILFDQSGIPLSDPRVARLRAKGLGVLRHVETYTVRNPGVRTQTRGYTEDGAPWTETRITTPVGELSTKTRSGWVQEYLLKTPQDYKAMEYVVRDRVIEPNYAAYEAAAKEVGEDGVVIPTADRTPYQKILVDLAGLEALSFHLLDAPEAVRGLCKALDESNRRMLDVIMKGPGEMVKLWENITGDAMGNDRFEEFHVPLYKPMHEQARAAGKLLVLHLDGRLACLVEGIKKASFDVIESFTPAPEGNLELSEALRQWPGKTFWLTVPSFAYESDRKLADYVGELVRTTEGRNLVLEIAEYYPEATWEHHMELMLDTAAALKAKGA
jgi:hypothetical protein